MRIIKRTVFEGHTSDVLPLRLGRARPEALSCLGSMVELSEQAPPSAAAAPPQVQAQAGLVDEQDYVREMRRQRLLVQRVVSRLASDRHAVVERAQRDVVRLALAIARRVLRAEVRRDAAVIERVVEDAIRSLQSGAVARVRVHPDDLSGAERAGRRLESALAGLQRVEVQPDPTIQPGGCIVETELGTLDAQVETQLSALEEALLEAVESA